MIHLEWLQDFFAHEIFPGLTGLQLNRVSGSRVHHVVVKEYLAGLFFRFEILQSLKQLLRRIIRLVPDGVVPRDARSMRQHVAQRYCVVQEAVVKLDRGNRFANGPIPGQLSFFN